VGETVIYTYYAYMHIYMYISMHICMYKDIYVFVLYIIYQ
jgi:hypothetical protein